MQQCEKKSNARDKQGKKKSNARDKVLRKVKKKREIREANILMFCPRERERREICSPSVDVLM